MSKGVYKDLRTLIISSIFAIILLIVGYFYNNLPIFTGIDLTQFLCTQRLCERFGISHNFVNDDAFFVNVSYDKELVDAKEKYPEDIEVEGNTYLGKTAITDRGKLYKFLKILDEKKEYKYIILDITFDRDDRSETDDLLYPLIANMNNIVVIRDNCIPDTLKYKSALATYFHTITETSFIRYQYLNKDDIPYIPLKIYEDSHPQMEFKRYGLDWLPIYTSGGQLCHNSCFVAFDSETFSSYDIKTKDYPIEVGKTKSYYNLGADILEDSYITKEIIHSLSKNKYVFIGNYLEGDLHGTYMGARPGPFILYRALKTLEEEKHIISFWRGLYWFIVFTFIFWWIIGKKTVKCFIPSSLRSTTFVRKIPGFKLLMFIVSSIGYGMILFLCSILEYIFTCNTYSIILPIFTFAFIKLYYDYKRFQI